VATAREIRRRIQSIHNLGQVTRALQAVAASNMRKAQQAATAARPYAHAAWEVIVSLGAAADASLHPLLTRRSPVQRVLVLLISGEQGLCGAYNQNVVRVARDFVARRGLPAHYITVGRKGRDLLWRMGAEISAEFHGLPALPSMIDVSPVARAVIDDFLEEHSDEVYLARTEFVNVLVQKPIIQRLFPLRPAEAGTSEYLVGVQPSQVTDYVYEPDIKTVLEAILPRFSEIQVYQAVLEAHASEYAARMIAMRNATDNAAAMVDDLTLDYNKVRQQSITNELLDIAGGAEIVTQSLVGS
jgi:F-type H+-transporting ATPase subunit gamma